MKLSELNEGDTKEIVSKYFGEICSGPEVEKLSKDFHKASKGSARNLSNLLPMATKITSMNMEHTKGKINNKSIDEASKMLASSIDLLLILPLVCSMCISRINLNLLSCTIVMMVVVMMVFTSVDTAKIDHRRQ